MTEQTMAEDTRIDRWLCAVRLVKTRPMATQLCEAGHVRVNGNPAKPSTKVRAGDTVQALIAERERVLEVVRPIETRVRSRRASGHRPRPRATSTTAHRRSSGRSRPASWPSVARAGRASAFAASSSGCAGPAAADSVPVR